VSFSNEQEKVLGEVQAGTDIRSVSFQREREKKKSSVISFKGGGVDTKTSFQNSLRMKKRNAK
jgi:hypothetical protein